MALIIRVFDKNNRTKPLSGITVGISRPRIIGREIPTKKTNSEGKAFFELKSCNAIVTINGITSQKEEFLKDDMENVFYI